MCELYYLLNIAEYMASVLFYLGMILFFSKIHLPLRENQVMRKPQHFKLCISIFWVYIILVQVYGCIVISKAEMQNILIYEEARSEIYTDNKHTMCNTFMHHNRDQMVLSIKMRMYTFVLMILSCLLVSALNLLIVNLNRQ